MDITATSDSLAREIHWLDTVIQSRIAQHFNPQEAPACPDPPDLERDNSPMARAIKAAQLTDEERRVLALALAPFVLPEVLDPFLTRNPAIGRVFSEFCTGSDRDGPLRPTLGLAMFLAASHQVQDRLRVLAHFAPDAPLMKHRFLDPLATSGDGVLMQPLALCHAFLSETLTGQPHRPQYSPDFPATRLGTAMSWSDLILSDRTRHDVEEILAWIEHSPRLRATEGIGRLIKPGFKSLFHGPPGTGKTLTAALLGKRSGRDVYRIDLSMVVSKWIGETEKNLARIFDQGQAQDWILFFDEADALFGKRSEVTQSNDRYANQEVSYILQRVEEFDGIILLASNLRGNIDPAFIRRFQSVIRFDLPAQEARDKLWKLAFPDPALLAVDVDLMALAKGYELTGASIVNAAHFAHMARLRSGAETITQADLIAGIGRELQKSGKIAGRPHD